MAQRDSVFGDIAYGTNIRVFFQDKPDDLIIFGRFGAAMEGLTRYFTRIQNYMGSYLVLDLELRYKEKS